MIRIQRADDAFDPKGVWRTRARAALALLEVAAAKGEPLDADKSLYAADAVRLYLWETQNAKCCYCEKPIGIKFQHVDHFRPKLRARRGDTQYDDGYWWLSYAIWNLLLSCPECNNYKKDWFPLEPGSPVPQPKDDPFEVAELATIIDPVREDPEDHLTFVELPTGKWRIAGRSERGWTTIRLIHLDSDVLDRQRDAVARDALHRRNATSDLAEDVPSSTHFAALVRAVLRSRA